MSKQRYITQDGRYANAEIKAQGTRSKVWRIGARVYKVHSGTYANVWYQVEVTARGLECSCRAGQAKQPCYHAAKVAIKLRKEGKPTVYAPIEYGDGELFDEELGKPSLELVESASAVSKPRVTLEELYK